MAPPDNKRKENVEFMIKRNIIFSEISPGMLLTTGDLNTMFFVLSKSSQFILALETGENGETSISKIHGLFITLHLYEVIKKKHG